MYVTFGGASESESESESESDSGLASSWGLSLNSLSSSGSDSGSSCFLAFFGGRPLPRLFGAVGLALARGSGDSESEGEGSKYLLVLPVDDAARWGLDVDTGSSTAAAVADLRFRPTILK